MNIITISREFGSGGRELGKKLANELGYDYYDSEIITFLADAQNYDPEYVENLLNNHEWESIPVSTRNSFTRYSLHTAQILVDEKKAVESIGQVGHNFVIVGKNADVFLQEYNPLTLFVCGDIDYRVKRCMERKLDSEEYNERQAEKMIRRIDKTRAQTRDLVGGSDWGKPTAYDLCINTTNKDIDKLAKSLAVYVKDYFNK